MECHLDQVATLKVKVTSENYNYIYIEYKSMDFSSSFCSYTFYPFINVAVKFLLTDSDVIIIGEFFAGIFTAVVLSVISNRLPTPR